MFYSILEVQYSFDKNIESKLKKNYVFSISGPDGKPQIVSPQTQIISPPTQIISPQTQIISPSSSTPISSNQRIVVLKNSSGGLQAVPSQTLSPAIVEALKKQGVNIANLKGSVVMSSTPSSGGIVTQTSGAQLGTVLSKTLTQPGSVVPSAPSVNTGKFVYKIFFSCMSFILSLET